MTCVAFLLLGSMLLGLQILSEALIYATLTEPIAISTELFSIPFCCLDYAFIPSSMTYKAKEEGKFLKLLRQRLGFLYLFNFTTTSLLLLFFQGNIPSVQTELLMTLFLSICSLCLANSPLI